MVAAREREDAGDAPPWSVAASTAPADRGAGSWTRRWSRSWSIAASTESPSSGSAFWSPRTTKLAPGRSPPRRPASSYT
ncbi:Uncharacterised protein [Mycobacteroides abscessus]|nr:Uncharacterised protein [Mycobacteroides abscessus]